ncbi:MAG: penicillin-insensitive murein endopeptidase [Desulfobacteraceae bacterium]|nr:penicillin-insensitive murein endopeptidase [Desulfobacteraceae bacterium]
MEKVYSIRALNFVLILSTVFTVTSFTSIQESQALTASYGRPYGGRLESGIPFPSQFPGYRLREESRTYTTPEVIGALLDAIEAVRTQFPDTCDLYMGDFSTTSGGSAIHHRSHQNGRDVDVGMYAKGNRPLDSFIPMSEDNLDAAKTWCLIENIIRSQRVQYIFLDRRVQKVLYDYAVTRGYDQAYLDRVFGNVRGSLIQHVRNHVDHMHVRFFTPWSTLAGHIGSDEVEKRMVVEMAQQSYLPKKVNYFVQGSEKGLDELARSFGVTPRDLCRWNRLNPSSIPVPGSCLVFYKRSFESEPVHLARSLQPGYIAEAPTVRMASIQASTATVSDASRRAAATVEPQVQEKKFERAAAATPPAPRVTTYYAKKGDTLDKIARRNHMDVSVLCQLNGMKKTASLKPGQAVKMGRSRDADAAPAATTAQKKGSPSQICFTSDPKKPDSPTAAYYTVTHGGTVQDISKRTGIPISSLCQLNGLNRNSKLKSGQKIKLTQANLPVKPTVGSSASCSPKEAAAKSHAATKSKPADKASKKPEKAAAVSKDTKKSDKSVAATKSSKKNEKAATVSKDAKKSEKAAAVSKDAKKSSDAKAVKAPAKAAPKDTAKKATPSKGVDTKSADKGKPVHKNAAASGKLASVKK